MKAQELRSQFTEEFFEEFQFDGQFRNLFRVLENGLTPYEAIEHLCKSNKDLLTALESAIENYPRKISVAKETFDQLKDELPDGL